MRKQDCWKHTDKAYFPSAAIFGLSSCTKYFLWGCIWIAHRTT